MTVYRKGWDHKYLCQLESFPYGRPVLCNDCMASIYISSVLPVSEGVGAAVWEGETAFGGW